METRKYPITVMGETYHWTLRELKWYLTREAYDMYFKVHFQRGQIQFGVGSLCTLAFMEEFEQSN